MKKTLKKHERQNIKRRYGCDWKTYIRSYQEQSGLCAVCGQSSRKRLRVDAVRSPFEDPAFRKLLCVNCHHVIKHCGRPGTEGYGRLANYLGLVPRY